jgi:multidrug efflux pump subunit AcrB
MTLGGLALVIGLLIDESIVVLENISRHLATGKGAFEAARDGASEVTRPLTIVTVTISIVFFPIVFLTGIGKFLFTPLAMSVIFAICTSRLLATTLVPVCAAKFFRNSSRNGACIQESEEGGWFSVLRRGYAKALRRVLHFRWLVLGATAALFVVSLLLLRFVGTELFPQVDAGQFMIRMRATPGLRIEQTERLSTNLEEFVRQIVPESERKMVIANLGVLYDWPAAYTPNSGPQDAFVLVQLQEPHKKSVFDYVDELRGKLPRKFPGTEFNFDTGGLLTSALNFGLPSPIDIQIEGNKLEVAHEIADQIQRFAQTVPGAVDARIEQRLDAPQINVDVDRIKAAQLGLSQETVVRNIVTAFNSSINFAPSFWVDQNNGNHYFVGAQYREDDIKSLETAQDIPITDKSQPIPIPLRNIAKFTYAAAPVEINHHNITRVTDVFINVRGRDVGSVATDLEKYIGRLRQDRARVPEGYFIQMRGEVQSMRESFKSFGFGFALAVVLVYLVMVFQFRSFVDPFIVMFAVPLGAIGVAGMLFVTSTSLNIQSVMGSIMMVGIVVSFSVLLVEFANHLRSEAAQKGTRKTAREAIVEAASIRLRPILMTGLSAILGLTPMAISGGANIPLARAVVGGVIAAMVMVLFVVPILYLLLNKDENVEPRTTDSNAT